MRVRNLPGIKYVLFLTFLLLFLAIDVIALTVNNLQTAVTGCLILFTFELTFKPIMPSAHKMAKYKLKILQNLLKNERD